MTQLHGLTVEQRLAWERDGFLAIESFLNAEELAKYNQGLDEALATKNSRGTNVSEHAKLNHVEQVTGIIEYDQMFMDLLEHPRMMNIMRDVYGDAFLMIDNEGMFKYPGQKAHTNWHRDTSSLIVTNGKVTPYMVKVFYFLSDVPYNGGCLSFLPGSHHMHDDTLPRTDNPDDFPGHVRMNVKAGTAVLFNGYSYHSALNNHSDQVRRTLVYNYGPLFLRTWPGYEPSERLQAGAETQLTKMLLGMLPWMADPKVFT